MLSYDNIYNEGISDQKRLFEQNYRYVYTDPISYMFTFEIFKTQSTGYFVRKSMVNKVIFEIDKIMPDKSYNQTKILYKAPLYIPNENTPSPLENVVPVMRDFNQGVSRLEQAFSQLISDIRTNTTSVQNENASVVQKMNEILITARDIIDDRPPISNRMISSTLDDSYDYKKLSESIDSKDVSKGISDLYNAGALQNMAYKEMYRLRSHMREYIRVINFDILNALRYSEKAYNIHFPQLLNAFDIYNSDTYRYMKRVWNETSSRSCLYKLRQDHGTMDVDNSMDIIPAPFRDSIALYIHMNL